MAHSRTFSRNLEFLQHGVVLDTANQFSAWCKNIFSNPTLSALTIFDSSHATKIFKAVLADPLLDNRNKCASLQVFGACASIEPIFKHILSSQDGADALGILFDELKEALQTPEAPPPRLPHDVDDHHWSKIPEHISDDFLSSDENFEEEHEHADDGWGGCATHGHGDGGHKHIVSTESKDDVLVRQQFAFLAMCDLCGHESGSEWALSKGVIGPCVEAVVHGGSTFVRDAAISLFCRLLVVNHTRARTETQKVLLDSLQSLSSSDQFLLFPLFMRLCETTDGVAFLSQRDLVHRVVAASFSHPPSHQHLIDFLSSLTHASEPNSALNLLLPLPHEPTDSGLDVFAEILHQLLASPELHATRLALQLLSSHSPDVWTEHQSALAAVAQSFVAVLKTHLQEISSGEVCQLCLQAAANFSSQPLIATACLPILARSVIKLMDSRHSTHGACQSSRLLTGALGALKALVGHFARGLETDRISTVPTEVQGLMFELSKLLVGLMKSEDDSKLLQTCSQCLSALLGVQNKTSSEHLSAWREVSTNFWKHARLRLFDLKWEVRDSAVSCIFDTLLHCDNALEPPSADDDGPLLPSVLQKLTDGECYVRLTCLSGVKALSQSEHKWKALSSTDLQSLRLHFGECVMSLSAESYVHREIFSVLSVWARNPWTQPFLLSFLDDQATSIKLLCDKMLEEFCGDVVEYIVDFFAALTSLASVERLKSCGAVEFLLQVAEHPSFPSCQKQCLSLLRSMHESQTAKELFAHVSDAGFEKLQRIARLGGQSEEKEKEKGEGTDSECILDFFGMEEKNFDCY